MSKTYTAFWWSVKLETVAGKLEETLSVGSKGGFRNRPEAERWLVTLLVDLRQADLKRGGFIAGVRGARTTIENDIPVVDEEVKDYD